MMSKTCGDPVFKPFRSELLAEASEELLRHMLKAFPSGQRVSLLLEIFETLSPQEKLAFHQAVSRKIAGLGQDEPALGAGPPAANFLGRDAEVTRGEPIRPKKEQAFRGEPTTSPTADRGSVRKARARPGRGTVEAEFQKFAIQNSQSQKSDMRKQLIGCLGLGILIFLLLTVLSVGGRKVFDWLLLMMG